MIKPNKEEHAILVFPNDTRVEMHGDLDIIKKVIARLDGLEISYATDPNTEVTSSDTNKPNILNDKLLDLASEFKKLLPSEYWKPLYYGAQIPKILELIATKEQQARINEITGFQQAMFKEQDVYKYSRKRIKELKGDI